jgi:DNA-binding transcriptional regulator YiaG
VCYIFTQCVNAEREKKHGSKRSKKSITGSTGMNRKEFCEYYEIPYRTVTEWKGELENA